MASPVAESSHAHGTKPRMSLWAVASFLSSLLIVPPMCLLAAGLGVVGLLQVRTRAYSGRGFAVAGIVIGALVTVAWVAAGAWWHVNVRRPLIEGPREALVAGFQGDAAAFVAQFVEARPEAEAGAFLAELARRYGSFRGIGQDRTGAGPRIDPESFDPTRLVVPYRIAFERAEVRAEAEFVRSEPGGFPMILRWGYLVVRDAEQGDLAYPRTALPPEEAAAVP